MSVFVHVGGGGGGGGETGRGGGGVLNSRATVEQFLHAYILLLI